MNLALPGSFSGWLSPLSYTAKRVSYSIAKRPKNSHVLDTTAHDIHTFSTANARTWIRYESYRLINAW